jgi:hypothetical protein
LVDKLGDPGIRQRLIRHFPEAILGNVLSVIWTDSESQLLIEDIRSILSEIFAHSKLPQLRERLLHILVERDAFTSAGSIATSKVSRALAEELRFHGVLLQISDSAIKSSVLRDALRAQTQIQFSQELAQRSDSFANPSEPRNDAGTEQQTPGEMTKREINSTSVELPVPETKTGSKSPPSLKAKQHQERPARVSRDQDAIYIRNGGLVILAPYLRALFAKVNLLENRTILDVSTALQLTHYLAFGTDECQEWELVLNKILCGAPLNLPFERRPPLSADMKAEGDRLLMAVIANWPALKNTSPAGLRSAFLQRDGAIRHENNSWRLRLSRTPFDVLMDQLPWTISMIQLPWMPELLYTDWAS